MIIIISAISCTEQKGYPATITEECDKSVEHQDALKMPHGLPFETRECSATGKMNKDESFCSGLLNIYFGDTNQLAWTNTEYISIITLVDLFSKASRMILVKASNSEDIVQSWVKWLELWQLWFQPCTAGHLSWWQTQASHSLSHTPLWHMIASRTTASLTAQPPSLCPASVDITGAQILYPLAYVWPLSLYL